MPDVKLAKLIRDLQSFRSAVIAFSGGVDSTFLVKAVQMAGIRFLAVISDSETMPAHDRESASAISELLGLPLRIIRTGELRRKEFYENPRNRCFYCKDVLFGSLREIAREEGYDYVLDGSNADDAGDYRPGLEANRRHGVISPLMDEGFSKEEIRRYSRELGLPTWDKPSSPCLSSRFPYGERITESGLKMVGTAEKFLRDLGFRTVRVRTKGKEATIETGPEELTKFRSEKILKRIWEELTRLGYDSILIDTEGYRSGKLNGGFPEKESSLVSLDSFLKGLDADRERNAGG